MERPLRFTLLRNMTASPAFLRPRTTAKAQTGVGITCVDSDRHDELIFRSSRLNDPFPTVTGIDLFASIDQPEEFQEGHVPFHCFPVSSECRSEF